MGNETQRHTEFLGVLSGHRVDASVLRQPLQALCQHRPVYWTRRAGGESSFLIHRFVILNTNTFQLRSAGAHSMKCDLETLSSTPVVTFKEL